MRVGAFPRHGYSIDSSLKESNTDERIGTARLRSSFIPKEVLKSRGTTLFQLRFLPECFEFL